MEARAPVCATQESPYWEMDGSLWTTLTPRRYSWLAYVLVGMPDKGMVGFGRGRSNDSTVKAIDDAFFEGESGDGNLWHC